MEKVSPRGLWPGDRGSHLQRWAAFSFEVLRQLIEPRSRPFCFETNGCARLSRGKFPTTVLSMHLAIGLVWFFLFSPCLHGINLRLVAFPFLNDVMKFRWKAMSVVNWECGRPGQNNVAIRGAEFSLPVSCVKTAQIVTYIPRKGTLTDYLILHYYIHALMDRWQIRMSLLI